MVAVAGSHCRQESSPDRLRRTKQLPRELLRRRLRAANRLHLTAARPSPRWERPRPARLSRRVCHPHCPRKRVPVLHSNPPPHPKPIQWAVRRVLFVRLATRRAVPVRRAAIRSSGKFSQKQFFETFQDRGIPGHRPDGSAWAYESVGKIAKFEQREPRFRTQSVCTRSPPASQSPICCVFHRDPCSCQPRCCLSSS